MADPIDPEKIKQSGDAAEAAAKKIGLFEGSLSSVVDLYNSYVKSADASSEAISKNQRLTEDQSKAISLLSATLLQSRTAFQSFSVEGIGSFKDSFGVLETQIDSLTSENGGFGKLLNFAKQKIGINIDSDTLGKIGGDVNKLASYIKGVAGNMMQSADNAIKLERVYLSLGARTGELGDIFSRTGDGFLNLNAVMSEQRAMIDSVAAATNHSIDEVEKFYAEIGAIPGALKENIAGLDGTAESMTMLEGAIHVARGTGQDFKTVVTDLNTAFTNYGLTGEAALTFTTRISELSSNLKIRMEDVRAGVLATAQAFRGLADTGEAANRMAEGAAKVFNQYVSSLKETGMTGQDAINILTGMETQVKNLTLAQKGFLSAQTGGAGGLRGAFQIEQMMREGDIEGVMEKVRKQMEGQLGKIVTVQEAAGSDAAAAQLTRQIMILKQGPLGGMAKTDQDAMRLLEGLKGMQEGKGAAPELKEDILKGTMQKGNDIQQQSFGELQKIRSLIEQAQSSRDIPALGMMQQTGTAAAGQTMEYTAAQEKEVQSLKEFRTKYSQYAESLSKAAATTAKPEIVTGEQQFKLFEDISKMPASLLNFGEAMVDNVKGLFTDKKPAVSPEQTREELSRDLARANRERSLEQPTRQTARGAAATGTAAEAAPKPAATAAPKTIESKVDLKVTAICMHCKTALETNHARVANGSNT